jgi:hypothetical protein
MNMLVIDTPKEHLNASRKHHERLGEILSALDPLPIYYFSYHQIFNNGVTCGLYSEPEGLQKVLESGLYAMFLDEKGIMLPEGYYFSNDVIQILTPEKDYEAMEHYLKTIREIARNLKASWDDAFFIIRKNDLYHEIFYFYFNVKTDIHRLFFLNHLNILNEFCYYFLSEAEEPIKDALMCGYKYPITPKTNKPYECEEIMSHETHTEIRRKFELKKFRFVFKGKEIYLTSKEFNTLKYFVQSEKPSIAAAHLGLSVKGYESTIQRIKNKFNTSDKKELHEIYTNSIYAS